MKFAVKIRNYFQSTEYIQQHFDETYPTNDETTNSKDEAKKVHILSLFCIQDWKNFCKFAGMKKILVILIWALQLFNAAADDLVNSQLSYRRYTTSDGLPQMQAEIVWQDSRGYIYIGTLSGFVRFDGLQFTPYLKGRRENIVSFTEVDGQVRAFGFRRQWLVEGDKTEPRQIDPEQQWLLNNFNASDLPSRTLLLEDIQEQQRRLCTIDDNGIHPYLKSHLLDLMTPDRKIYIDSSGTYIPTEQGLYLIKERRAQRLTAKKDFFSLIRSGSTLFAFAADSIYTISKDRLEPCLNYHFDAPDYGLFVRRTSQGELIIADSHTIYLYDGKAITRIADGFNMVKGLLIDHWNRLWVATYQGVYCFFHMDFVKHRLADKNDIVRAIAFDDSLLVAGTLNGSLLTQKDHVWTLHSHTDGGFYAPSAAIVDHKVYLAGNGRIACFDGTTMNWLQLPNDRYQFVAPANGRLIIGSRRQVLAYYPDTQQVDTLTTDIPHPWTAAEDAQGRLWIGTSNGLFCMEDTLRQIDYHQKLVITTMECDKHGNIFFASADSLFMIHHGEVSDLAHQLPELSGHEIRSLHVSPQGFIVVAAIDGLFVGRIDKDSQVTDLHFFDHTNGFTALEPLKATMAETPDGTVWMAGVEEMTSFLPSALLDDNQQSAIIPAPKAWWQCWWVWLLAVLLLAFVIWLSARRFEKHRHQMTMIRLQREKRQKELQINAIRLQAIPHFHTNVLASIEYFMMNNSVSEATHYLKLYSDFTNQTLGDLNRPSRSIAEEIEYVKNYLELEQLRYGERLRYNIQVANGTDKQAQLPTMLLHTYCQNAIKHGIGNKDNGGRIDVFISQHDVEGETYTTVQVKDDGVGREKAAKLNTNSTKMGLKILKEQISLYNQTNQYHISQTVTDLFSEDGKPAGTSYVMTVPTDYNYE